MPYNPGITARGEILGQSIGAAGQSIAQAYGQGLQLQEEQKRYNKKEKQRKKDRRFIEDSNIKRAGILADALYEDEGTARAFKETIEAWDPADVAGWIQGQTEAMQVKAQQTGYAMNVLKLGEFEEALKQKPIMSQAMRDMAMGTSEQNLSAMDSLDLAMSMNPDLSPANVLQLNQLVQARQSIQMEGKVLELREVANQIAAKNAENSAETARIQGEQAALAAKKWEARDEKETAYTVTPEGTNRQYDIVGGRPFAPTQVVADPVEKAERDALSDTVDKKVATAVAEADQIARGGGEEAKEIKGGDEYTGAGPLTLGLYGNRYDRLAGQLTELQKASDDYEAKTGKEHPQIKSFYDRVSSLVMHMREQGRTQKDILRILQSIGFKRRYNQMKSEGRDKEAKQFSDEFGVTFNN